MLTIKQIFSLGLDMAVATDPRGSAAVKKYLARVKKEYDELKDEDKKYFDKEDLTNPYSDSRVHVGDDDVKVSRILTGIDIDAPEILLASQLNERDKKIDLVLAHHPMGMSLAKLHHVMDMGVAELEKCGLPVHLAETLTEERIKEVSRGVHPINHFQEIDIARVLGVNVMNTHTITDNLVQKFITDYLIKKAPETAGELLEALLEIPEYQEAKRRGAGPRITAGGPKNRVGKFMIEMTGGTNPSKKIYEELSRAGISTIVGMHMPEASFEKISEQHMNVIIAGHISSDSLGMNLFLDELEKKGIEIVPCGGLIRVSRVGKKR